MFNYLMLSAGPQADEAKIRQYVEQSMDHYQWLVKNGVPFKYTMLEGRHISPSTDDGLMYSGNELAWPFSEHAKPCPRAHSVQVEGSGGGLLMKILISNVEKRGIPVHYEARVLTLITDMNREVHGFVVRMNQKHYNVRARKGVVLCAGGFVMNESMLKKYAPQLTHGTAPCGNPGDTGAGILMGMGVGAAAINMHEGWIGLPFYPPASLTYGILVNAAGQRFINEDTYHGRIGHNVLQQPDNKVYLVFGMEDYGDYEGETIMHAEIAGTGETIEELELELGLPEAQLAQTVEVYNRHAESGEDPLFHKASAWLKPMKPPFAALNCTPGQGAFYPFFTLGGLDTLPSGEVLTASGDVIPGLYAAGRTACGVPRTSAGYCSGLSVGDATMTGRMAGKKAATAVARTLA